jgi:hypothetical protein
MASRQAVLLTPLESFHPRLLPSRHRINRVHPAFCKKQPFSFHALAGTHFATLLFSILCRNGGYLPSRQKSCSPYSSETSPRSPKPFKRNTYTISRKCSFQRTYRKANSFRINTYKKPGGGATSIKPKALQLSSRKNWPKSKFPPRAAQFGSAASRTPPTAGWCQAAMPQDSTALREDGSQSEGQWPRRRFA